MVILFSLQKCVAHQSYHHEDSADRHEYGEILSRWEPFARLPAALPPAGGNYANTSEGWSKEHPQRLLVQFGAEGQHYGSEHVQQRDQRLSYVCHGDQCHPDGEQATVKVAELQDANFYQTETVFIFARVTGMIKYGEEHGEEIDNSLSKVLTTYGKVNAWNKQ